MVVVRDDIVAWYELCREEESGTTWDEHAQLDGTINGGATLTNDNLITGSIGSFDFDGTDGGIFGSGFSENTFSFTAWIKPDDLTAVGTFPTGYHSIIEVADAVDYSIDFRTEGNKLVFVLAQAGGGVADSISSTASLSVDTKYHVGVTFNSSTGEAILYIDGSEDNSATLNTTNWNQPSNTTFRIANRGDDNACFDGTIAGVHAFNRVLTGTEVSADYNSGDGVTYRSFFDLEESLEGAWPFDGDANDATGNGNNGTVNGATSGTQGIIGTCYTLDGTNDYIEVPNDASISGLTNISFYGSIKPDSTGAREYFLAKGNDVGSTNDWEYGMAVNVDATVRVVIRVSGTTYITNTTSTVTAGEWSDVGFSYDGDTLRIYFDGVEENSDSSMSGALNTDPGPLWFGAERDGGSGNDFFGGEIDEWYLYSRTLSPGEFRRHHSFAARLRYEDLSNESFLIDGVAAAYNWDGDVLDAKNNTYDGTNNGTTTTTGVINDGRDYPGASDYVDLNFNINPNNDFTIATWANIDVNSNDNALVGLTGASSSNYWFFVNKTSGAQGLTFQYNIGSGVVYPVQGTTIDSGDGFVQTAVARKGNDWTLYKAGSVLDTGTDSVSSLDSTNPMASGFLNVGTNDLDGQQDITTIWGRGLSSTEINAYNNGGSGIQFPFTAAAEEVAVTNAFLWQ